MSGKQLFRLIPRNGKLNCETKSQALKKKEIVNGVFEFYLKNLQAVFKQVFCG